MQGRRWAAAVAVAGILVAGCSGVGPGPSPEDSASVPMPDLPAADAVVAEVAAALTAVDVTDLPLADPAAAQQELEAIYAGMDGLTPTVTAGDVDYRPEDSAARAELLVEHPVGTDGWSHTSQVALELVDDQWQVTWSPTIIHPQLTSDARLRHRRDLPKRAAINDNQGLALVEQRTLYQVGIDKSQVPEAQWASAAAQLAALLEVDPEAFATKVAAGGQQQFVVARTLEQEEITPDVGAVPGGYVKPVEAVVPFSDTFAVELLGIVGSPTAEQVADDPQVFASDTVGLSGLQARYDERLRGVPEARVDLVARDDAVEGFTEQNLFLQDASVGTPLQLSLDRDLQSRAEALLAEQPGLATLVVIDNTDGALLAAATSPEAGSYPQATFGKFAPGSTFKVVSALAMLRGGMTPDSGVQCPASLDVAGKEFGNYSDYPAGMLGSITLTQALAHSCNTSFAAAAQDVSPEQLHAAAASLGVGTDYDAGFASNFGTVAPNNSPIDRAASMIGQGQITMSPMGMAAVAASVARGVTTIPWLVRGETATPNAQALTADEAAQLRRMMQAVVTDGSGRGLAGLMAGAKTGTAEFGPVGDYKTHAWMIAYNDDVSVSAFVQDGVSGSQSAAPLITELFS